jgi:hypothetical protein
MNASPDFLGRLAARALGQTQPLAPRPASPFEGSAGLTEEASPAVAEDAPRADSPRSTLAVPMDFPPADSPPSALTGRPEPLPRRDWNHAPETPAPGRNWDHTPEGPGPEGRDSSRAPERPAPKGRNLNSLGLQPQVPGPQDPLRPEGAVPFLESLPSLSVPGPIRAAEGVPRPGLKPPLQAGPRPSEAHPAEPRDEISASSLAPRTALEPESLAFGAPNQAAPRPAVPAAEPVIRVTIGRIEVRAVAPAAPAPPAARPAAPRLGLAEYLRRRGEGRP